MMERDSFIIIGFRNGTCGQKVDDDSNDSPSRIEVLLEKAKTILINKGHDRDVVETALDWIDQRAYELGKTPVTVSYYLAAFANLEESLTEKDLVLEHVKKRRALYAKFGLPLDLTNLRLTQEQEKGRR